MEMISIPKERHDELVEAEKFLNALQAAGVDNWEGYHIVQESME